MWYVQVSSLRCCVVLIARGVVDKSALDFNGKNAEYFCNDSMLKHLLTGAAIAVFTVICRIGVVGLLSNVYTNFMLF